MKKIIFTLIAISMVSMSTMSVAAMSTNKIRKETRFLTDKMAYELNLNTEQYNDTYEINYDFIYNVGDIMDDVIYGDEWALDKYYQFLDIRNDDLRWVLEDWQYERFLDTEYFYRPIYSEGSSWGFRIYLTYTNPYVYYFGVPYHYRTYSGGHYRTHFGNNSYYSHRYHHNVYIGNFQTRNENVYINNRRSDFGRDASRNKPSGNNNRRSSSRILNDDLYNTGRSSGSSRSRVPGNVTRPSDNRDGKATERPSSEQDRNKSGRDENRDNRRSPSNTNTGSAGNTDRSSSYSRPASSSSERSNSTYRGSDNNSNNNSSVNRSSGNTDRSSSYSRPASSSSERSNSVSRSSDNNSNNNSSVTRSSGNAERSSSYSRPASSSSERSNSVSRSSESNNSSARSSNKDNNSRSSESSRGGGRTR